MSGKVQLIRSLSTVVLWPASSTFMMLVSKLFKFVYCCFNQVCMLAILHLNVTKGILSSWVACETVDVLSAFPCIVGAVQQPILPYLSKCLMQQCGHQYIYIFACA